MARYQIPPDPRADDAAALAQKKSGRLAASSPPWLWIGLGAIVTVLAIAVAVLWAQLFLDVKPSGAEVTPSPVMHTATPSPMASPGLEVVNPTATLSLAATQVPVSTATLTPIPAGVVAVGVRVTVFGTGVGLNLRSDPSTSAGILTLINDGSAVEVIDGPAEGDGYIWWRLRAQDGTEGWGVADFLQAP